jgi:hypothetical protein
VDDLEIENFRTVSRIAGFVAARGAGAPKVVSFGRTR